MAMHGTSDDEFVSTSAVLSGWDTDHHRVVRNVTGHYSASTHESPTSDRAALQDASRTADGRSLE